MPVFCADGAEIVGRVEKTAIGDDFRIAYVVICLADGEQKLIYNRDFKLTTEAVVINHRDCMKSYSCGEELSVYQLKLGDKIFDHQGKELGILSDFLISEDKKKIRGVEVSSGAIQDFLQGRQDIDLAQVHWASTKNAVVSERSSTNDDQMSGL